VEQTARHVAPIWFFNPSARTYTRAAEPPAALKFHRCLAGYHPTPLIALPLLGAELGIGRLYIKDESKRFDLASFKFLGASWAAFRALQARSGYDGPDSLAPLASYLRGRKEETFTLIAATDGNHGRAVARIASLLGLPAQVYIPEAVPEPAVQRVAAEGAAVKVVAGGYDAAVSAARSHAVADYRAVLVQDTAWPGYTEIPSWVVQGYATLLHEIDNQLAERGISNPHVVAVPVGVGSLAQAVVAHYRAKSPPGSSAVLGVEADTAACLVASLSADQPVSLRTGFTVMNGLNCGTVSPLAWPLLRQGLDAAIAVSDVQSIRAVADLARSGVQSGPSGAASFAGVRAAVLQCGAGDRREALGMDGRSVVVCISTEGPLPVDAASPAGHTELSQGT